jgi:mRNA interferase RelE/StbE
MAWNVEVSPPARKQLDDLDAPISRRIFKFLYERVAKLDDPRQIGERLKGTLSEFWKYRVGDYRLICSLEHDRLVVLVLRVGHRREIYSR